jgi:F-type H+-transporting ATPase subunit delta
VASQSTRVSGLAVRYAAALFELAEEAREIDAVAADLAALQSMLDESADLRRFIASPVISRDDHARGILALADTADVSEVTRKFLGLIAAKGRLSALPGMILGFQRQLAKRRGELTAEVVSARPLTDAQSAALAARLKQVVGNEVSVASRVDPALLGGMVVRLGSRMVDSSLRSKLQRLSLSMKGVG